MNNLTPISGVKAIREGQSGAARKRLRHAAQCAKKVRGNAQRHLSRSSARSDGGFIFVPHPKASWGTVFRQSRNLRGQRHEFTLSAWPRQLKPTGASQANARRHYSPAALTNLLHTAKAPVRRSHRTAGYSIGSLPVNPFNDHRKPGYWSASQTCGNGVCSNFFQPRSVKDPLREGRCRSNKAGCGAVSVPHWSGSVGQHDTLRLGRFGLRDLSPRTTWARWKPCPALFPPCSARDAKTRAGQQSESGRATLLRHVS